MEQSEIKLTILFEDPFWIGLCERQSNGRYEVCKMTFGAEPKDYEVSAYLEMCWKRLVFSPSISAGKMQERRVNPKRMQREVHKQLQDTGIGTKAQQALKLQQEEGKAARKKKSREQKDLEKERQFAIHLEKQKEKHRGH